MVATTQPTQLEDAAGAAPASAEAPKTGPKGITITASAADEIRKQAAKRGTPEAALRVGIRGGGCTGFSYLFEWADGAPREKDRVFEKDGMKVFVDPKSLVYLDGTELDFVRGMMGHGFKFNNPNAKGACGCGESVQF